MSDQIESEEQSEFIHMEKLVGSETEEREAQQIAEEEEEQRSLEHYAAKLSIQRLEVQMRSPVRDMFQKVESDMESLLKMAEEFSNYLRQRQAQIEQKKGKHNYLTKQPSLLRVGTLKNYQMEGLNWMISLYESQLNGILADQMGLGKTIQTIAFLAFLKEYKYVSGPHLIIAPLSTLGNWTREFTTWFPSCRVIKLIARVEQRAEILKQMKPGRFDVVITSYEGLQICWRNLNLQWHCLIVDEAHKIKNAETQLSTLLRKVRNRHKFLLTGTPLQNNPHELWSLLNYIMPQIFTSSDVFDNWQSANDEIAHEANKHSEKTNLQMIDKLKLILQPFMLRRTKDEVEKFIPPKQEINLYFELLPQQRKFYRKIILNEEGDFQNKLIQLRKICLHMYMFPNNESEDAPTYGEHLIENSSKLKVLDMFLQKLSKEGHKVLIFSQFTTMLNILEDYCTWRDYDYCRLDGMTAGQDREDMISDFQDGNKFLFLLSTRAGGLGITLTAADTVIIYDSDFNPQQDLQAMDRVHRIGQTKPVMVYRLVCKNTVEEKIIERQQIRIRWEQLVIANKVGNINDKDLFTGNYTQLINHGAAELFKDTPFTDDDIDKLLERGKTLTKEMEEELDKRFNIITRDSTLNLGLQSIVTASYAEVDADADTHAVERMQQLLKIKTGTKKVHFSHYSKRVEVNDWQLFDNPQRLRELKQQRHDYELYRDLIEKNIEIEGDEILPLNEDEEEELSDLQLTGSNWTRGQYDSFLLYCQRYGRFNPKMIAEKMNRTDGEVAAFIKKWNKNYHQIENGEKMYQTIIEKEAKIREKEDIIETLKKYAQQFKDPENEMTLNLQESNDFTEAHDVLLTLAVIEEGLDDIQLIKQQMLKHPWMRFDFVITYKTADRIKNRVNKIVEKVKQILNQQQIDNRKKQNEKIVQKAKKEEQKEPIQQEVKKGKQQSAKVNPAQSVDRAQPRQQKNAIDRKARTPAGKSRSQAPTSAQQEKKKIQSDDEGKAKKALKKSKAGKNQNQFKEEVKPSMKIDAMIGKQKKQVKQK